MSIFILCVFVGLAGFCIGYLKGSEDTELEVLTWKAKQDLEMLKRQAS